MEEQAITCVPDITRRDRNDEDSFLLVACDGIWDVLTSHECGQFITEAIAEREADAAP